ncbi:MAG TPA: hypothetical protein VIY08_03125 [Candidatus Nitrosocosmicus sp.]
MYYYFKQVENISDINFKEEVTNTVSLPQIEYKITFDQIKFTVKFIGIFNGAVLVICSTVVDANLHRVSRIHI